jgi:chorismate synthase
MSWNSFGRALRVTTWGESHGPAIGALVEGCPAGIALDAADIQPFLDRRRPGQSRFTTMRREPDRVRIEAGVAAGRTTGGPLSLVIDNVDQRSKDYGEIAAAYRPGHADYAYDAKYGLRDWRGGGRASARETAMRVAAGAVARKLVPNVRILAYVVEIGGDSIADFDARQIDTNPFFCPDAEAAVRWAARIDAVRKAGDSLGAVVECAIEGAELPVCETFGAMMSINAVKGVEMAGPGRVRIAFKPTSSILTPVPTIDRDGRETEIVTRGRHDPCVGIRGAPVVEAMAALVLADARLQAPLPRGERGWGEGTRPSKSFSNSEPPRPAPSAEGSGE